MKQITLLLCSAAISMLVGSSHANANDSPQAVASANKITRQAYQSMAKDVDALLALSSEVNFTQRLMEVCRSNSKERVAAFLKSSIHTKNQIVVDSINNDFCLRWHVVYKKTKGGFVTSGHIDCYFGPCRDED
jgi:hypothetical protein